MPAPTLDPAQEPGTTLVLKSAVLNLFGAVRESLKTEALMLTEHKADETGETAFNPFKRDESAREILSLAAGILLQAVYPHQLEDEYIGFLLDNMLPKQDTPKGGA